MKPSISIISGIVFFSLFALYAGFEAIKVALGPSLVVNTPKEYTTVDDPLVKVSGQVKRAAYITINDRQIFADLEGNFSVELLLPRGYSIIEVEVRDRFDKEVTQNISILYESKDRSTNSKPLIDEGIIDQSNDQEEIDGSGSSTEKL